MEELTFNVVVADSSGTVLDSFEIIIPTEEVKGWSDPKVARLAVLNAADNIRGGIL